MLILIARIFLKSDKLKKEMKVQKTVISQSIKRAIFNFDKNKNIIFGIEVKPFNKTKSNLLFDLSKVYKVCWSFFQSILP